MEQFMTQLVLREDRDAISILTLNRPDKLNALSPDLFVDLRAHISAIEADPELRCVVLKGAGRSFSAGADIEALNAGFITEDPEFRSETVEALGDMRAVVIAAVRGHCYTGGFELACAADVIIAADNARFCDTHARLGIVPRWGLSARLPRRVGLAAARRISMTCKPMNADEALRIGLCDYIVPHVDLEDFAIDLAIQTAENDPKAIAGILHLYNHVADLPLSEALNYERGFSQTPSERAKTCS
jgi:enoyl-CoA hydratase/carnithine racemase